MAVAAETPAGRSEPADGWPLVWALSVAQLVSWGTIYYGFSLFVVPMEAELGWSRTALNAALSVGLLAAGLTAYPVGAWIDRHGGRVVMSAGSILATLLFVAWSRTESLWAFFAIWFGLGVAMSATLYEPVFTVLTRRFPGSFRRRITMLTLVGGFASTVFIPLTQLLIDQLGWRDALLGLAVFNLAISLPIHALWLRDGIAVHGEGAMEARAEGGRSPLHRALRQPVFWCLAVSFTAYTATFSAITFHIIPLLAERGVPAAVAVAAIAVIGPAQVAGRILILTVGHGATAATVGRIVTPLFAVAAGILIAFPHSIAALFLFAGVYGAANGSMTIVRGTAVPDLLGREGYGAVNGALALPATLAKAAAPFVAALVWQASGGYDAVLWLMLGGGALTAGAFWLAAAYANAGPQPR